MRLTGLIPILLAVSCSAPRRPAVRPSGSEVAALVETGERLRRCGDLDAAERAYRAAIEREPDQRAAHAGVQAIGIRRGLALDVRRAYREVADPFLIGRLEGDPGRARRAFEAAPEPQRTLGLASLALRRGDRPATERAFRAVTEMDPALSEGWLGRGRMRAAEGRFGEARSAFLHAVWIAPGDPRGWSDWAAVARRLGRHAEALHAAEAARERDPLGAGSIGRWISATRRAGGEQALREVARVLGAETQPPRVHALLRAARLHAALGERESADRCRGLALRAGALQGELEATVEPDLDADLDEFVTRLRQGMVARYRHFRATGEADTLPELRDLVRRLYEEVSGETLAAPGPIERYAFVGDLVDPTAQSAEPLVRRLGERGLLLILGRRSGGPPEAMLAQVIRRTPRTPVASRGATVSREAIWIGKRYLSGYVEWTGGGDLAGLALGSVVLVDVHAAAEWEGELRRRRDALQVDRAAILAQEPLADTPVDAIDDPAGVAQRLLLDADPDIAGEVLVHEDAHLVDADRYLPGRGSLLAAFGLALRSGLSAGKVLAKLERNAQLAAIAEGPDPRTALAICCASIGGTGVHARGYSEIVAGIVRLLLRETARYPDIDRGRVVVQQLHRLSTDEIRALAIRLGEEWGVWAVRPGK